MTHGTHTQTDVVVIGGGPVGMTSALALAARGVRVTLIERRTTTSDDPKAISLDDESLRLYQSAGVVDRIMPIIVPGTGTRYFGDDGQPLFHARSAAPYRLGYPFKNSFAQPDLEHVLFGALTESRFVDTRFGTELREIGRNDERGVSVTVEGPSGPARIDARFLVGADGGRSAVRRHCEIPMLGRSFPDLWLVADTVGDTRHERYGMHHGDSSRPHVVIPGLGGRCRYEFRLFDGETDADAVPPFELIERLVGRYRPITPDEVERAVVYRFHALNAARWRDRSVFLAGDAAHMMPPFAGQGLNSGIRDAANLGWKLAEALHGTRSETFLDSYETERRPHADAVIRSSVLLGRVVMSVQPRVARYRDRILRDAMENPDRRAFFEEMRYRPPYRLTAGAVAAEDAGPLVGTQIGQPRAFHFGRRTVEPLDEILGDGWAVAGIGVAVGDILDAAAALASLAPRPVSIPLDDQLDQDPRVCEAIDLDTRLYAEFSPACGRLLLLRPDRFVAASWRPGHSEHVRNLVSTWTREPGPILSTASPVI